MRSASPLHSVIAHQAAQTTKLHELIRDYVGIRLGKSFKLNPAPTEAAPEAAPDPGATSQVAPDNSVDTTGQPGQADTSEQSQANNESEGHATTNAGDPSSAPGQAITQISDEPSLALSIEAPSDHVQAPSDHVQAPIDQLQAPPVSICSDQGVSAGRSPIAPPPPPAVDEEVHSAEDLGVPQPDGQGGLLLSPRPNDTSHLTTAPHSLPFPPATDKQEEVPASQAQEGTQNADTAASEPEKKHTSMDLLPEIGKLMREIVRNGEEKYAVALGAYNAVSLEICSVRNTLANCRLTVISEHSTRPFRPRKPLYCSA